MILALPFPFELLQFPVVTQPFPNGGRRDDQQNDDGEADSEGETVGKQDHLVSLTPQPGILELAAERTESACIGARLDRQRDARGMFHYIRLRHSCSWGMIRFTHACPPYVFRYEASAFGAWDPFNTRCPSDSWNLNVFWNSPLRLSVGPNSRAGDQCRIAIITVSMDALETLCVQRVLTEFCASRNFLGQDLLLIWPKGNQAHLEVR